MNKKFKIRCFLIKSPIVTKIVFYLYFIWAPIMVGPNWFPNVRNWMDGQRVIRNHNFPPLWFGEFETTPYLETCSIVH